MKEFATPGSKLFPFNVDLFWETASQYDNTPIQIYLKFHHKKTLKVFR